MSSEEKAWAVTMAFEGGGYDNLSGSFDGMGVSFGALQWNVGKGTLQSLVTRMAQEHPAEFRRACDVKGPPGYDLAAELLKVASMPPSQAVKWAEERQDAGHRFKPEYRHWVTIFKNLGREPVLQAVQRKAGASYMATAKRYLAQFGFRSERALCLLFDVAVQMGSIKAASMARYNSWLVEHKSAGEADKLEALARAVAPQGGRWENDVLSRKLTCAKGLGIVHGRAYNLAKDFGVTMAPVT